MSEWSLIYGDFNAQEEPLREALCTLGNGYFATRGAAPEATADDIHYPGTYIAGCFNRLKTHLAGETIENECMVNIPNWLPLTFRIENGDWFDLDSVDILDFHQELNLHQGILTRTIHFDDGQGRRTIMHQERLVSMEQPHLAALKTVLRAENWSGTLEVCSALDGRVTNSGVARYREFNNRHLSPLKMQSFDDNILLLEMETNQSHIRVAQAAITLFSRQGESLPCPGEYVCESDYVAHYFKTGIETGTPLAIEKIAVIYTSRDRAISEPAGDARQAIQETTGFDHIADRHRLRWKQLWDQFALNLSTHSEVKDGNIKATLRLHIMQLLQTTSPHILDLDVSVPARGLHGEAYRGHIFWDELFVFPFFNLRIPEITRSLLQYRYRRLDAARRSAQAEGYKGAMFPWQSGSNGREESQTIHLNPRSGNWIPDNSRLQRHISAAVAFNVWHYVEVTDDCEFLSSYGAEMLLEIARFWSSIASYNEEKGRYEILGVMGPDEYHDAYPDASEAGIDNNAYTNVMAAWVLLRALELRTRMSSISYTTICERLQLTNEDFNRWADISRKMFVPFHDDGIISQFEAYDELQEFDWEGYRNRYGDIHRLDRILEKEDDTPNRYKVSKQADVLMLFYLFTAEELRDLFTHLGYAFEHDTIPRNIDYYMARTSHGSTLSQVVNSWVLARSDRPGAWPLFCQALSSDVDDIQGGTTQEGIHTGAMAGTVDIIQRCFTGIETRKNQLWVNPALPPELRSLTFRINYRAQMLDFHLTPLSIRISADASSEHPIRIGLKQAIHELEPGQSREFAL